MRRRKKETDTDTTHNHETNKPFYHWEYLCDYSSHINNRQCPFTRRHSMDMGINHRNHDFVVMDMGSQSRICVFISHGRVCKILFGYFVG